MKIVQQILQNPRGWSKFDQRAQNGYFVFKNAASVNRFCARYKVARAFKGVELDGIGDSTRLGYGAMLRLILVWGALEALVKALNANMYTTKDFAERSNFSALLTELHGFPDSQVFFKFVNKNLNNKSQSAEVDKFLQGKPCNCITLAKVVRHIFLHGLLSPSVKGADPTAVSNICNLLSDCLFEVIDREFNANAERLEAMFPMDGAPI
jgi:hypothetical protein